MPRDIEKKRLSNSAWKLRNPEKERIYKRKWHEANRFRINAEKRLIRPSRSEKATGVNVKKLKPTRVNKRDSVLTVVYVIKAGDFVKIGIAENVVTRLIVFRTHCPLEIELLFCSTSRPRPEAREIEICCHNHFSQHNVHGEWFKVNVEAVIEFIQTKCDSISQDKEPVQLRLVQ